MGQWTPITTPYLSAKEWVKANRQHGHQPKIYDVAIAGPDVVVPVCLEGQHNHCSRAKRPKHDERPLEFPKTGATPFRGQVSPRIPKVSAIHHTRKPKCRNDCCNARKGVWQQMSVIRPMKVVLSRGSSYLHGRVVKQRKVGLNPSSPIVFGDLLPKAHDIDENHLYEDKEENLEKIIDAKRHLWCRSSLPQRLAARRPKAKQPQCEQRIPGIVSHKPYRVGGCVQNTTNAVLCCATSA